MEGYHILIVEDDKEIREGIEIYLKNQGYIVFQAAGDSSGYCGYYDAQNGWHYHDDEGTGVRI